MGLGNWLLYGEWEKRNAVTADPSPEILPPSRVVSDRAVTVNDAFTLGNVYRAISIISTAAVQLSLDTYRAEEKIDSPSFIRRPDVNDTFAAFLEMTVVSLAVSGNAYWRVKKDAQGRVSNLEVLNPLDVTPNTTTSGRIVSYGYTQSTTPIPAAQMQHLKLLRVPGSAKGLGPIQAAQSELRGAIDVRDYASNWFRDSGVPSGLLSTDIQIADEDAKEAAKRWNSTPAGQVRVLGDGLKYQHLVLAPEDAQFIENRRFSKGEIASLFGIPASLMNAPVEGTSMTYSNISQAWTEFARFTLATYTREIEEAFSALLPRGTRARFNNEALLRPDTKTRYEMHSLAMNAGWMTANDVRKIEGLEPLDGGNELRKPTATTPPQQGATNA